MRLIDADALKKAYFNAINETSIGEVSIIDIIDNAPTALFPLTVMINDKVNDENIELLKQVMKDYKPQILNLERPQGEYTEEDIKQTIEENFDLGYAIAKNKYERPQGRWVSVSERLPEKEGFYLVFLENEQMVVAHSSGIIANHDFEPKMLAWQPLPEPYKEGGAE